MFANVFKCLLTIIVARVQNEQSHRHSNILNLGINVFLWIPNLYKHLYVYKHLLLQEWFLLVKRRALIDFTVWFIFQFSKGLIGRGTGIIAVGWNFRLKGVRYDPTLGGYWSPPAKWAGDLWKINFNKEINKSQFIMLSHLKLRTPSIIDRCLSILIKFQVLIQNTLHSLPRHGIGPVCVCVSVCSSVSALTSWLYLTTFGREDWLREGASTLRRFHCQWFCKYQTYILQSVLISIVPHWAMIQGVLTKLFIKKNPKDLGHSWLCFIRKPAKSLWDTCKRVFTWHSLTLFSCLRVSQHNSKHEYRAMSGLKICSAEGMPIWKPSTWVADSSLAVTFSCLSDASTSGTFSSQISSTSHSVHLNNRHGIHQKGWTPHQSRYFLFPIHWSEY